MGEDHRSLFRPFKKARIKSLGESLYSLFRKIRGRAGRRPLNDCDAGDRMGDQSHTIKCQNGGCQSRNRCDAADGCECLCHNHALSFGLNYI